jgi:hypothetical protein
MVEREQVKTRRRQQHMITNFERGLLVLLACSSFFSCTIYRNTYNYGNLAYDQPESALAAQQTEIDIIVSQIPPTDHPVGGSAIIIVPSVSIAMKTLVGWRGSEPRQEQKDKFMRFTATSLVNGFRGRGEEIQKRRIFDRVTITESDSPENATFSEDTAILLIVKNGNPVWLVKNGEKESPVQTEIEEVSMAVPPVQRNILWLDRVEKALRRD